MFRKMLIISLILLPPHAMADDDTQDRKVIYQQKTEIDFEDLNIEGTFEKPQSALVLERKQASFNPLIKLRTDFNDKIEENTEEVK
jgi:hypothetical protein